MEPARQNISQLIVNDDVTQTKFNQFAKELQDLGASEKEIKEIAMGVAKTASNQTTAKISLLMDDSDWSKWKAFVDSTPTPNVAQQLIIMNKFLEDRTGKSLETLHLEILDSLLKDTLDQIQKRRDMAIKVSKLSDEQIDTVNEALDNEEFDKADDILNSTSTN